MAVDRDYLQAQITTLRMLADAAERAGDTEAAAMYLRLRAQQMDRLRELEEGLTAGKRSPKVRTRMMPEAQRKAISEGGLDHPAMAAARAAGYPTLGDIAEAIGCKKSFLSQVFSGDKKMPDARAKTFERLTKYPATLWKS